MVVISETSKSIKGFRSYETLESISLFTQFNDKQPQLSYFAFFLLRADYENHHFP